ncbi:hypothetical protein EMCRGX_G028132 [Ephydatia muelleri]
MAVERGLLFTRATRQNACYSSLGEQPRSYHDNEDRVLLIQSNEERFKAIAIFDGHESTSASDFAYKNFASFLHSEQWHRVLQTRSEVDIKLKLEEFFRLVDIQFLESINPSSTKNNQELESIQNVAKPITSGGCSAVVVIIFENQLYVANVGDAKAVVVSEIFGGGSLIALQLSTDHSVNNKEELKRLEKLGLDPEELKRAGRLGPQENTRSIGDYNIKGGYTNVESIKHAIRPPSTSKPSIRIVDIAPEMRYLMVMSDGVYKSIEAALDEAQNIGANQVLANMVHRCYETPGVTFSSLAQTVLDEVAHLHEEAFHRSNGGNLPHTKVRKDMTLAICKFSLKNIQRGTVNYHCKDRRHWVEESFQVINTLPQQEASIGYKEKRKLSFVEKIGTMAEAGSRGVVDKATNIFSRVDDACSKFSTATLINATYSHNSYPKSDKENEDRSCHLLDDDFKTLAVLDGHKGSSCVTNACDSIAKIFFSNNWKNIISRGKEQHILLKLKELIKETEIEFIERIQLYIDEVEALKLRIPSEIHKSYAAYEMYPTEVSRLEELEPLISGGCTAVVAVVCGNKLYVANVGDSRAVVVYQTPNGALETLHLGLDPEELKRAGRLGPQENTRSIGDYNIKGGYKSVDVLSHASGPPGTAEPAVTMVDIDRGSFLYLMVMSDGVYKSIEAAVDEAQTIGANQVLANMVHTYAQTPGVEFSSIAQSTLDQVAHLHEEAFQRSPEEGPQAAVVCLFEPKPEFPDKHGGLLVAHSVSLTHSGKTTVQLLNPTAVLVTLYGKETLGELSWLRELKMVGLVEPSLDKKPAVRSEEAICKVIEDIMKKVQDLTVSEREGLRALLKEHSDVGDGYLGRTSVLRHKIDTGDAAPIHQPARRLPFHQRGLVQNMIKGMLDQGIVEPAEGAWSSPIVLAKKMDGSYRFCVDFRSVNDVTKKDVHSILRIDDYGGDEIILRS